MDSSLTSRMCGDLRASFRAYLSLSFLVCEIEVQVIPTAEITVQTRIIFRKSVDAIRVLATV